MRAQPVPEVLEHAGHAAVMATVVAAHARVDILEGSVEAPNLMSSFAGTAYELVSKQRGNTVPMRLPVTTVILIGNSLSL